MILKNLQGIIKKTESVGCVFPFVKLYLKIPAQTNDNLTIINAMYLVEALSFLIKKRKENTVH